MTEIVTRIESEVPGGGPGRNLEFAFRVEARPERGQRKRAEAWPEAGEMKLSRWAIQCDEGAAMNGDDSAPPPLAYFATGIAFCLLTQITRAAEMRKVALDDVRIDQTIRFYRTGSMMGGTIECGASELEYDLDVDSDEPEAEIRELIRVATDSCFAHAAITQPVAVKSTLTINGERQPALAEHDRV